MTAKNKKIHRAVESVELERRIHRENVLRSVRNATTVTRTIISPSSVSLRRKYIHAVGEAIACSQTHNISVYIIYHCIYNISI